MNSLYINQILKKDSRFNTLSLDVFDTFLLRNHKPEIERFVEVALQHVKIFKKYGSEFSTNSLLNARLMAHKIGYRTAPLVARYRDASIRHIYGLYLKFLGISSSDVIEDLIEYELRYEECNLRLNQTLCDTVLKLYDDGVKIYFISDMYFSKNNIKRLIQHFISTPFYEDIYVSSEYSAAKSTGLLFKIFLRKEKKIPEQLIHVGDNFRSDYLEPRKLSIHSIFLPVAKYLICIRNLRNIYYHIKYREFIK